jgi:hypothetical protein
VSRARLLLHVAALLAPFSAAFGFAFLVARDDRAFLLRQTLIFGGGGAIAAEIAAFACWPSLERRAREGRRVWRVAIGMAALTHALFGVLAVVVLAFATGWSEALASSGIGGLSVQVLFFIAASVFGAGFVTFPATVAIAETVAPLRRKELAHAA